MAANKILCLPFLILTLVVCTLVFVPSGRATAAGAEGIGSRAHPEQQSAAAPQAVVDHIEFIGNRRVRSDTLRARIFTRDGDPYTEEGLRRDFQALWNTQFFEDIRLEVEDVPDKPNAKVIVFYLKERPIIRRIEYKGNKSVTESEILERFKDRKVGLSVESQFDPTRIKKAEVVLRELLGERGRQYAVVKPTYERIAASNAVKLIFVIEEGSKVKVGQINFVGNQAFSDRKIIRAMRHSRPVAIPLGIGYLNLFSKTYDRRKLNEDLEVGVRGLYQDHGYFQVLVKDPLLETEDVERGGVPLPLPAVGRKHGKRTDITIPIDEGDRFRMGKLFVRNSDPDKGLFFKPEFLQSVFPLKEGDIFAVDKVRKALEEYTKLYGNYGYIDFTASPLTDVDTTNKKIDLTLEFDEQKQYFVRHIEFQGNVTTRDKVIRREILLDEGNVFNRRLWEVSILRLNQLDYFEPIKAEQHAEIKRNVKEGTVDVLLKLKEKGKQSIGLTGGVSGLAGSFIGLSYQTNNFLGLGETLTFSAEFGDRQRNFLFGFTEPYLFDRPISSGFTVFSSRFSFNQARETSLLVGQRVSLDPNATQNYNQNSKGFTLFASYPLRRFSFTRLGLTYGLTNTNIDAFSDASRLLFEQIQFRSFAGPSALRGIRSSRLVPTLTYNTVDNPINAHSGKSFFYSMSVEGGPVLRGNVNAVTNIFETKYFRPVNKRRNVLGFRALAAYATGYGSQVLPPFNRFYLGGEDTVRGFDIRTIGPVGYLATASATTLFFQDPTTLDGNGNPLTRSANIPTLQYNFTFPGGDTQGVGNVEYRVPIVGPVTVALFFDVGINGALRRSQLQLDPAGLDQLRTQFPSASISSQLPLQSGTNFKMRTSTGIEFVVQLPIVNAPFRLYWAYNLNRLHRQIITPPNVFTISENLRRSLPPGVLESQILPQLNNMLGSAANPHAINFFEPMRTFRFTVSRTF